MLRAEEQALRPDDPIIPRHSRLASRPPDRTAFSVKVAELHCPLACTSDIQQCAGRRASRVGTAQICKRRSSSGLVMSPLAARQARGLI
ncbi:hypothetical protein CO662_36000 [Rhizobium anhuiense]|uniref:Uncharacterized protein n=5 Tax=Rhizobium TaxID=379 RepID=B3Q2M7_RHIE6|nr:hypothetical protein RHECIAT_PB0000223 [Rhizobium etli CIAT 652]KKZ84728.1 hypothetical protein RPHASCH2410_PC02055 [Rhizobium phaseoli Ch24-10]PCD64252.1 hypothetical protein CO648_30090 [Rhizobium phaseoli]PCK77323.1 hypothetical protein CPT34_30590 [Rhizobium sophoriradicis]PDS33926.1 hypothetical protein CO665_33550 [Rhizobium anhuiense]PDS77584.1 hypothetical protein CO654_33950 [Rhizobium sp. L18]PDS94220.1 hypothetical protein CO659_30100 [Rhizobium sp. S9]PDT01505.1 hypothetical p